MYSRIISKSPVCMSVKSAPTMNILQAKRREKFVLSLKADAEEERSVLDGMADVVYDLAVDLGIALAELFAGASGCAF